MSYLSRLLDLSQSDSNSKSSNSEKIPAEQSNQIKNNQDSTNQQTIINNSNNKPFDIKLFQDELYSKSENRKRAYAQYTQNISAYDIAVNCIRQVLFKLYQTPVKSYADKWLPVLLRSTLGSAVHDFIQNNTNQFTEVECSLKVPSIRFSGRLDALIGDSILVEIKSMSYNDYDKVLRSGRPRTSDFYQAMCYKYILEHYLDELKQTKNTRTKPPKLDKYNITKLQFIYIAHDIMTTDIEDFDLMLEEVNKVKKMLKSKYNTFHFMSSLVIDVSDNEQMKPYIDYIVNKITTINNYLRANKMAPMDDPFVNKKSCYFCIYKDVCQQQK